MAHERFAEWLDSTGWTQEEAAEKLGCSQSTISAVRLGDRRPGVDLIHAIERLSRRWVKGPIRTEEWVEKPSKKAA